MHKIFILFILIFSFNVSADNKTVVQAFYETAFSKHLPSDAMKNFVGDHYIQHNPHVKNGKEPFIQYFTKFYKENPSASTVIKRIVAENNFVVVHAHSRANEKDRGYAAIDIFRLENEKIVEHWDAVQAVPEKSANTNSMF